MMTHDILNKKNINIKTKELFKNKIKKIKRGVALGWAATPGARRGLLATHRFFWGWLSPCGWSRTTSCHYDFLLLKNILIFYLFIKINYYNQSIY
jgi:hypothetical protein